MSVIDDLIVRVKRGDTTATRTLRTLYQRMVRFDMPETPVSRNMFSALYRGRDFLVGARELATSKLLYEPMARARFAHVGRNLQMSALPYLRSHADVSVGNDCSFGYITISSGKYNDKPEISFGDNCTVATGVVFIVNQRIRIGNFVGIAGKVRISDSAGHPTDLERRLAREDMGAGDIAPVTIEDYAWIGHSAHIQKGVTIGEAAIVAPGSVVVKDVPPGSLAMGVPARNIAKAF